MAIEITQADLADPAHGAGLLEVLDAYAADPMGGSRPLAVDARERLIAGLRAQPGAIVLLAREGAQAVGLAVCFRGFSTFAARPLLNVHDLAVLPHWRGRGIGRALLQAVEQQALQHGCVKITLEVRQDNARARALYKSFGFGDFVTGGETTPSLFLEKRIESPR
jgi:ribosomal protein S18 acetylase RimI-like enzyme